MEKSKGIIICGFFLALGGNSVALAEETIQSDNGSQSEAKSSPHHWSMTAGAYSDYLFRGLSFAKHG